MSGKGGAGKVYFILYLAVLLELLIIIVERDDAEDALRKEKLALEQKSKRIQLIAETIINSLRGTATSVSSTSDQSMILGDEKEANGREFSVRVRVADPLRDSVKELDLHILRNKQEMQVINLANDSVLYPRVRNGQDYTFKYNFKPGFGEGEYQLHFDARTNQIVGVTQNANPDDTVKIGAIHLTVKELKEVKEGIVENVALKGYIDSLLTGQYVNFATNIGSNEFTVNVKKKEAKVYDQLSVFPEIVDFVSFPNLELPNPIKIQGAETKGVTISKVDGPGEFSKVDTNWVWSFKPDAAAIGQTYTVHFKGQTSRGGGAKDLANGSFTVRVNKLEPANVSRFYPESKTHVGTPYTSIVFKANGKFASLDGSYRMELDLNGTKVAEKDEPTVEYTPEFKKDEGKKLEVKTYYKSPFMKSYVQIDDQTFTVAPPPIKVGSSGDLTAGDPLAIKVALGISGAYIEVGADHVDIESDGYFESSAKKLMDGKTGSNFNFEAKMMGKANSIRDKNGKPVHISVHDPITGQTSSFDITVFPKVQTKGRGGASGGGGGIH
jgi:hypothetical protein